MARTQSAKNVNTFEPNVQGLIDQNAIKTTSDPVTISAKGSPTGVELVDSEFVTLSGDMRALLAFLDGEESALVDHAWASINGSRRQIARSRLLATSEGPEKGLRKAAKALSAMFPGQSEDQIVELLKTMPGLADKFSGE